MVAQWLVCANCAGRVSEGRCPACRAERARLREQRSGWSALGSPAMLVALLATLIAVALLMSARPA